jgi:AraC family transcriptional regulator
MDTSMQTVVMTGVVPSICDAEAGSEHPSVREEGSYDDSSGGAERDCANASPAKAPASAHGFSMPRLGALVKELCSAVRSALDNERGTAEDSLRRAAEILEEIDGGETPARQPVSGGLAPWQIRKVTNYVDAHLGRTIRNEDLAALARLNPSHFGRAFRNSFGEPPHEYLIRRRVERAQGLMLSSDASLSDIALDCGLADQSHLTRLFRRIVGDSPRAWRRARMGASL